MCKRELRFLAVMAIVLACALPVSAAPKAKDNAPTEKELKDFATNVVAALLKRDIAGFLRMAEVPFHRPGGYFCKDKDELEQWITKALNNGPLNEKANEVKRVENFEAAKSRFSPSQITSISQVLTDGDFVVDVATEFGDMKYTLSLLIQLKAANLRVVGWAVIR